MRHFLMCVFLAVTLMACARVSGPSGGSCNEGLCVKVTTAGSVRMGEPITVIVTVMADRDISGLQMSLLSSPSGLIENDEDWKERGVRWAVDAKTNQPRVFTRRVRFSPNEGVYTLTAGAYTPNLPYTADSISVQLTRDGGKTYLSGTSVPIPGWTPGQPAPAVTVTRGPSPTLIPTPGHTLSPLPTPQRLLSPLATPTRATSP